MVAFLRPSVHSYLNTARWVRYAAKGSEGFHDRASRGVSWTWNQRMGTTDVNPLKPKLKTRSEQTHALTPSRLYLNRHAFAPRRSIPRHGRKGHAVQFWWTDGWHGHGRHARHGRKGHASTWAPTPRLDSRRHQGASITATPLPVPLTI